MSFAALPHILIIDDDTRIRDLVSRYLKEHGFVAQTAADAVQAKEVMKRFVFDALVVDVMMPGESGLEFTQTLRQSSDIPVLLLTALVETEDRIAGLETGADDYLPKPFEPRELVLRLQSLLKRRPVAQPVEKAKIGSWSWNPEEQTLESGSEIQHLTDMESVLLKALLGRAGEPISRLDLAALCGIPDAGERTVDVQVARLRRKLELDSKTPQFLRTVRGKGYMLRAEIG